MKTFFTFFVFLLFSLNIMAQDAIIYHVVPPAYESTPGNATFLSQFSTTARTYQLLTHDSLLVPLLNKQILAVSWRLPTSATTNWPASDITINNYDFYLGLGVEPSAMLNTNFSSNFVGPKKQVRAGSLTIPTDSYTFGNSPNNWGPEMMFIFDSVWVYNE